ncbi:MAG: hypothetical protein ACE5HO_14315, partial [bacterium]
WRDRVIDIDGQPEEWLGGMTFVEKQDVSVGFFNDADYLYVSLTSSNRSIQRQFMMMGFTLWFDPKGGEGKAFGIKFPVGMMETGMMRRGRGEGRDPRSMRESFEKALADLAIILPGEEQPRRLRVNEVKGIAVKIGDSRENFVYEIKVPLHQSEDFPYAINVEAGKAIGVGFETAKLDVEELRQRRGGGGFGVGRGSARGGFGGRPGRGSGRRRVTEPFNLWVSVKLSSENEPVAAKIVNEKRDTGRPPDRLRRRHRGGARIDGAPAVGELAPTFKLLSLDGKSETDLESFRGERPVVLFFGSYT